MTIDPLPTPRSGSAPASCLESDVNVGLESETLRRRIAQCPSQDQLLGLLKQELGDARARIRAGFETDGRGDLVLGALSGVMDALTAGILDFSQDRLYRLPNPTRGEAMAVIAVGGYGRDELAPGSDIDLLFLYPYKRTPQHEKTAEFLLYKLWDLGLKVGQAMRSLDETVKLAQRDLTVRTALMERRRLWGSAELAGELANRFVHDVCKGGEADFIEAKLAERDARHTKTGGTRYLLEPNIKEGKGGLRDLHTLMWIGRFVYGIETPHELVEHDILTANDLRSFNRSQLFLWAVRCHLHYVTGRSEERLTFDLQPKIAARMGYQDRPRISGVERFMKRYYLAARDVGALTRIVCAALEEQHKRRPRFGLPRFGLGRRRIDGFEVIGNRLSLPDPALLAKQPGKMLELFRIAQSEALDIHPKAIEAVSRNLRRIDAGTRADPACNRLFLEILTSQDDPAPTLMRMHEAGVIGRFVPEFARVTALMQYNLYHTYTVDEHTIRALQVYHAIETGTLEEPLPLATSIAPTIEAREELIIALFLHDIGKGRGGDHSRIGAEIATRLAPRFGLSQAASETVAWLVEHHLVMSATAFKRDLEDPKTIQDFVEVVQSPERLRLLLLLTVADIRAVGPNVWNGWKGQLLRELFASAEAAMSSGDPHEARLHRAERAKEALRAHLAQRSDWHEDEVEAHLERHHPRYWLGVSEDAQIRHALLMQETARDDLRLAIRFDIDAFNARTELTVLAADHPGLFMKLAGALAVTDTSIVDAHIFTTTDGWALDAIGIQQVPDREAVIDGQKLERIEGAIRQVLMGEMSLERELSKKRRQPRRTDVFQVEPRVFVNNKASRTHTVIEVNGRDRPGLLFDVAKALKDLGLTISSAHISTYGERIVDVFYVKDVFGMKVLHAGKQQRVRGDLTRALASP